MGPGAKRPTTIVVLTVGLLQILAWGSSFYLLGALGMPIAVQTGWPLPLVVGGISVALLAAGVVSPIVGRTIQNRGGRPVLAASSIMFAAGLTLLAATPTLPVYFVAWIVLGLAMAAGLYDPAFATLGRAYGPAARSMITTVTLLGGFASTIAWPCMVWLLGHVGWRGTCLTFAGLHAIAGLPAYLIVLPRWAKENETPPSGASAAVAAQPLERGRAMFAVLAAILTISAATLSLMSVNLLALLQARGLDLATAVGLGALIGPSQVAARAMELALGRRLHPVWTMFAGALMVATGVILLWADHTALAPSLIIYGAGNGVSSIVRGTVPLVLYGTAGYASLMGRLGRPVMIAMAAAPIVGAGLFHLGGAPLTFGVLAGSAVLNVLLIVRLALWCRSA